MQVRIFSVPIFSGEEINDDLNKFLRTVKVLEIEQQLVESNKASYWTFCIRYIEGSGKLKKERSEKVDYKNILSDEEFKRFSKFRNIRKSIAEEDGVPVFAVFTNEELAGIAKLTELSGSSMKSIKGIGDKKVEKYAERFIKTLNNEKS